MSSLEYADGKMSDAVRCMVTGTENLKERINVAAWEFGILDKPHHLNDLPGDISSQLRKIFGSLKSLNSMSDGEAQELAGEMFDVFYRVCKASEKEIGGAGAKKKAKVKGTKK